MKYGTATIVSVLLYSLLCQGCGRVMTNRTSNTGRTLVTQTASDVARVSETRYDASRKLVTLYTYPAGGQHGEDVVDIGNAEGIVNYATARYPNVPVQTVQVIRQLPAPTGGIAAGANAAGQSVEAIAGWVSYHSSASAQSPVVGRLYSGQRAPLIAKVNAYWYQIQVNGQYVYITTNPTYTRVVTDGAANGSTTRASSTVPAAIGQPAAPAAPQTTNASSIPLPPPGVRMDPNITPIAGLRATVAQKQSAVLQVAQSKLGTPYVWGHNEDRGQVGFDCSNFAEYVYHHALGYLFTTSSRGQYASVGVPVPVSQMRAGDLLVFNQGGHVGIYVGNGQMIQEGGGLGRVGYLNVTPGSYWGQHISVVKRMF